MEFIKDVVAFQIFWQQPVKRAVENFEPLRSFQQVCKSVKSSSHGKLTRV